MKYISTRSNTGRANFCAILLEGLAPDGGLYLPQQYPSISAADLTAWRQLSYPQLAAQIFTLFIDDIEPKTLTRLVNASYNKHNFTRSEIVPLTKVNEQCALLGLSYGPTLAFKDLAMQMLGQLFEYELAKRQQQLNILGATSGDTGSAAEYAMRGKQNVRVFMTSPAGRMSAFQQAQMFSLQDPNIYNIAIEGVFDDCQDIVKQISQDLDFKRQQHIGTVNSINWARLLAQVVYYVWGYLQATTNNQQQVSFSVPTGNFGNVCAGHIARMMGLPIKKLIVAVNENDVLDEFFKTGVYRLRNSANTYATSSPSMDISKASNFERFIFDFLARDVQATKQLFEHDLKQQGFFDLSQQANFASIQSQYGFYSASSKHALRVQTIKQLYQQYGILIDPHTADAWHVAQQFIEPEVPMLVLETALPVKFSATIKEALNIEPEYPAHLQGLEQLSKRVTQLPADVAQVKKYILQHTATDK